MDEETCKQVGFYVLEGVKGVFRHESTHIIFFFHHIISFFHARRNLQTGRLTCGQSFVQNNTIHGTVQGVNANINLFSRTDRV